MLTTLVVVAMFELCSRLVDVTIYPKWLLALASVFLVIQEIVEVHAIEFCLKVKFVIL
jgi:hypothetical protein